MICWQKEKMQWEIMSTAGPQLGITLRKRRIWLRRMSDAMIRMSPVCNKRIDLGHPHLLFPRSSIVWWLESTHGFKLENPLWITSTVFRVFAWRTEGGFISVPRWDALSCLTLSGATGAERGNHAWEDSCNEGLESWQTGANDACVAFNRWPGGSTDVVVCCWLAFGISVVSESTYR